MADTAALPRSAAKPQQTVNEKSCGSLWTALVAAQHTMPGIAKNKTAKVKGVSKTGNNYEMTYKYADISDVLDIVRPHLCSHGLAVVQSTAIENGLMVVRTRIVHGETGEFIEGDYPVGAAAVADHQKLGGALTYARRYSLCAMIGVAPDEDIDGQGTEGVNEPAPPPKSAYSLRRDKVWPPLIEALKKVVTVKDFKAWEEEHAEIVAQFPAEWNAQLQDEIAAHKEWLAAERARAREADEHV